MNPQSDIQTEADVESQLVLPYLAGIGVTPLRLRSQRTFSLRLGRNIWHRVDGRTHDETTGRLDYLVVDEDDRPLFVVEVKGPNEILTDDDRDQGVSYARLLHQIAPFVLVTNGRDFRLYDTITWAQIGTAGESSYARNGGRVVTDDGELRREALSYFVGYSSDNVAAFSRAQQAERMAPLRGGGGDLAKKYLPAVYTARPGIREQIDSFLESPKPVFVLTGASGVGKTNETCAVAEALGASHITLFFNGTALHRRLGETLADEFEWYFSETLTLPGLCRRLDILARRAVRPIVVIVDAVDEAQVDGIERELADLAGHLAGFEGRLKLVVSLKTAEWPRFSQLRDSPSALVGHVFTGSGRPSRQSPVTGEPEPASQPPPEPSFTLHPFGNERDTALARYSEAFGLMHQWPDSLRQAAADPFVMRMIAEVAVEDGALPLSADEPGLIKRYIQKKLAAVADPDRARRDLITLARSLLRGTERRPDAGPGTAAEHLLDQAADVPIGSPVGRDAVAFDLLVRSTDQLGRPHFGFAYDRVRHFVISAYVLDLFNGGSEAVHRHVAGALATAVGREAVGWFLPYASETAWAGIVAATAERLVPLLTTFSAVRSLVSPHVRRYMEPRAAETAEVGLDFTLTRPGGLIFCFTPKKASPAIGIVEVPVLARTFRQPPDAELREYDRRNGADSTYGRTALDVLADPALVGAELALAALGKAVKEGGLDEGDDPTLLRERVAALMSFLARQLDLPREDMSLPMAAHLLSAHLFPRDLEDLRAKAEALKRDVERQNGQTMALIVEDLARQGLTGVEIVKGLDNPPELQALIEAIEVLRSQGVHRLDSPLLPVPDLNVARFGGSFDADYSDARLCELLEAFFTAGLNAFDQLTKRSFLPALRDHVRRRYSGPLVAVVYADYDRDSHATGRPRRDFVYTRIEVPAGLAERNWAEARMAPAPSPFHEGPDVLGKAETSVGLLPVREFRSGSFIRVFQARDPRPIARGAEPRSGRDAPIRGFAYCMIEEALRDLTPGKLLHILNTTAPRRLE